MGSFMTWSGVIRKEAGLFINSSNVFEMSEYVNVSIEAKINMTF